MKSKRIFTRQILNFHENCTKINFKSIIEISNGFFSKINFFLIFFKGEKFEGTKSTKLQLKFRKRQNFLSPLDNNNNNNKIKRKLWKIRKVNRRTSPEDFGAPSPLTMFSRRSALRMGLYLGWRSRGWRGTQLRLYTSTDSLPGCSTPSTLPPPLVLLLFSQGSPTSPSPRLVGCRWTRSGARLSIKKCLPFKTA